MKKQRHRASSTIDIFIKYLSVLMVIVYVVLGILVLMGGGNFISVPDHYMLPVGLALLGYGLFRSYRVYVLYFK